jgi:hypothetical protein
MFTAVRAETVFHWVLFILQTNKAFSMQAKHLQGYTARYADLGPVKAVDGDLLIRLQGGMICGFAVLDASYKEKQKDAKQIEAENDMKQKV